MVYFDLPPEPAIHQPSDDRFSERLIAQTSNASTGVFTGNLPPELWRDTPPVEPKNLLDELLATDKWASNSTDRSAIESALESATEPALNPTSKPSPRPSSEPIDSIAQSGLPTLESPASSPPASSPPATDSPAFDPAVEEGELVPDAPIPTEPPAGDRPSLESLPTAPIPNDQPQTDLEALPSEDLTEEELTPEEFASRLKLRADYQSYNPQTQVITARGSVLLTLNDAIIEADQLWVNLQNRYTFAKGNVLLTRGSQLIRGSSAEYNFIQQSGTVGNATGTLLLPALENDLSSPLNPRSRSLRRIYDPINRNADLEVDSEGSVQITSNPDDETLGSEESQLQQLRFETDELAFDVEGWVAENVRITNDPFSPPELELRTDRLVLRNVSATQDELLFKRPRLVFDQGLAIPLFRRRIVLNRGEGGVDPEALNPVPVQVGVDGRDRGGIFIGRKVPLIESDDFEFSVTPQYSIGGAFNRDGSGPFDLDNFGGTADLSARLSERTTLKGTADLTSLRFDKITENLRTSLRAEQRIGDHRLALQYSYRERLFNGSLGFQDVQSSFGAVLLSPDIFLNDKGLKLTYQGSAQLINAETDREDLLRKQNSDTERISLGRYQASAALSQTFNLWRGQPKPPTQDEGLRFTPEPLVPYLDLNVGLRGTGTYYSSGDSQESLIADVGIEGQIGHLSRNFGDYTRYSLSYSQSFIGSAESPFLFDREVDRNVLTIGLAQQIYGPFILGFETAFSLSGGRTIDNIYTLEYSRRTYGILLRYDDAQSAGSVGFRISNFSWVGDTNPFDTPRTRRVQGGVIEPR